MLACWGLEIISSKKYKIFLCQEAVTHGDQHIPTMELANWWLTDKSLVHKLFKVLAPRLKDCTSSYTRVLTAPMIYVPEGGPHQNGSRRVVVELRGNPFPPLNYSNSQPNKGLIHNVLLSEARREARLKKEYDLNKLTKPSS